MKVVYFFLLIAAVLLTACGTSLKPTNHVAATLENKRVCRVVVLPFINESQEPISTRAIGQIFVSELVNYGNFFVAQEGDVLQVYQQLLLKSDETPGYEQLRVIGARLNADILVQGRVVEAVPQRQGRNSVPILGLILKAYDAKSGTTLWTTYHKKKGDQYRKVMHFGLINTIHNLCQVMVQEILISWQQFGFKQCEN